jgi:LacI family transcriptional regulator
VDGIIFLHRWPQEVVAKLASQIPSVAVVHQYAGTQTETVGFDDRQGMDLILQHLTKGGLHQLGFYGYIPEITWARSRCAAWMEAMLRYRLLVRPENVISIKLEEALSEVLVSKSASLEIAADRTRQGIQGWICANDSTALSLCHFLQKKGVRVPGEVQITGFHRQSHLPNAVPALTTIRVDSPEIGVAALRRLAHRFRYPKESLRTILLPCSLELGQTTLAART